MKKHTLCVTLAVICAMLICTPALPAAIDSEQQARAKAAAFAQAMDWPYGAPSKVRLDNVPGHGELWRVDFSGAARVSVDIATGEVVMATDFSQQLVVDSTPEPIEEVVGEQQAAGVAARVLDVVGIPHDAQYVKAEKSADGKEWTFLWARTFRGIPYRDDAMAVRVSALDGNMLGFGRAFLCAPPPDLPVNLSENDALVFAAEIASYLGLPENKIETMTAELQVVQPNNYWGPGPLLEDSWGAETPSRVAWKVTVNDNQEFWIDAADGRLLGGTQKKGGEFVEKRLSKKLSWSGAQSAGISPKWFLTGLALPLAALLFFFVRHSAKLRVRSS